ncbi:ATP-dependent nuclease, subunit A [Lachnospiraceae bacterium TWA4]|nr:ATP-dependent nuclease, subunit A [Lachnospiraceae bacterium TWA4]
MTVPAKEVKEEWQSDEPILIQGVIDLCFEEEDGIVLMDYKTDHADEEVLKKRYSSQFKFYKKAIEQMTGKKVKESLLYSFYLKKSLPV